MIRPRKSKPPRRNRAQALVEFTLTAMLLLLMLTLIIEVARIFQAYVTLQGAARAGARYAITGQWYDKYAGDPDEVVAGVPVGINAMRSGWNIEPGVPIYAGGPVGDAGDPYKHIPPCWPRFGLYDPYYQAPYYPYTLNQIDKFEPYRDARTCSIEETVIRGMTGLPMNAYDSGGQLITTDINYVPVTRRVCCYANDKPYTYTITVFGYTTNKYPNGGDFGHPDPDDPDTWLIDDYATNPLLYAQTEQVAGLSPGYGGDPGQKVSVQIDYRLGLITPILSRIVPSIPMFAVATMTNEQFGSTGVQSAAVLPPPLPELPTLTDPIPADVIPVFSGPVGYTSGTNPGPLDIVTFKATETNQGDSSTESDTALKLYYWRDPGTSGPPTITAPEQVTGPGAVAGMTYVGGITVTGLLPPGTTAPEQDINFAFPDGGVYYLYAVADANYVEPELGIGTAYDETRETNNVSAPLTVIVSSDADLALSKTVDNPAPAPGATIRYTISITNFGGAIAKKIRLTDTLPSGLTFVSANAPSGTTYTSSTGIWDFQNVTLNKNASATLIINARVNASTPIGTTITNSVSALTMDATLRDPDDSNDLGCVPPAPGEPDCKSARIVVGAINLSLVKTVSSTKPAEAAATSPTCPATGPTRCFTYTLEAKNLSTVTSATNVRIVDELPLGITFFSSNPAGVCTASGRTVTCDSVTPLTLAPDATVTRTLTVYANFGTGGQTLENVATVTAAEADPDMSNNTSRVSVLVQSIDIEVVKTITPLYSAGNTPFTWRVTVRNLGLDTANNVLIRDVIPTASLNTTGFTVTASTGAASWAAPNWTIPTLAPNATATLTIVASAPNSADNTTISNTATFISADKTDVNSANNTSTAGARITNAIAADIQLVKSISPTATGPNTEIVYTFTVTNNGPQTATGVVVTDTALSSNTTPSSATSFFNYVSPIPSTWNQSTGQWNAVTLTAGQSRTFSLTVKLVGNSTTTTFTNTASAAAGAGLPDNDSTNNTSTATLTVLWPRLRFFNAGGAGCNSATWGTTDPPGLVPHVWDPTVPYVAGAQGIYGSNFTARTPLAGYTYVDANGTTPVSADGQNLLSCAVTGRNFYYQFDGLATGQYQIVLLFADPENPPGTHRFTANALAFKVKTVRMLKNFDINKSLNDLYGSYQGAGGVHYLIKTYTIRVKNATRPYIKIQFVAGGRSRTYTVTDARINGIGITYLGP